MLYTTARSSLSFSNVTTASPAPCRATSANRTLSGFTVRQGSTPRPITAPNEIAPKLIKW
eukprot:5149013-Pyramimonas_sp.AAC.2